MIPFSFKPSVGIGLLFLVGAYYVAWRSPRGRRAPATAAGRPTAFVAGLLVILLALASPLDTLADEYLFSAHMVQHLLLTMLAVPLLLLGTPGWFFDPLARLPAVVRFARSGLFPVLGFSLFNLVFALSHVPWVYESALNSESVHVGFHLAYMGTAVLFWWPLLSPAPALPRLPYPMQLIYIFVHTVPTSIVGALIALADHALYPYYALAPRLWDLTPMADQQIAGLIMWVGGITIDLAILTAVFFAWAFAAEANRDPELKPADQNP